MTYCLYYNPDTVQCIYMPETIGILGGGQLGRMLTEAAIKLGYKVVVIDPTPNCPAKQVGAEQIVADYRDEKATQKLAERADYITIEFEHINAEVLLALEKTNKVNPAASTVKLIQDKYEQKKFLQKNGFPVADFVEIKNYDQAEEILSGWGGKIIIKSKADSFDGRGNIVVSDKDSLKSALQKFGNKGTYAEKIIQFKKEIGVMVAKDINGSTLSYPPAETVHARNICLEVYAPANVSEEIVEEAKKIAEKAVSKLSGAGLYGVELFLDQNDNLLINEIAPRVHNSGHYTMDMFEPSQFTQHILAITGQDLVKPKPLAKYCCMVNILGERDGPVELKGVAKAEKIPGVSVYIYGKSPTKVDRKMGHINATSGTMEEAINNARKARKLISI